MIRQLVATFTFNEVISDCIDLVIELHTMGAVSGQLLLHITDIKWKEHSYHKVYGAPAEFFLCYWSPAYPFVKTNC